MTVLVSLLILSLITPEFDKFPTFHRARSFVTVFTKSRYWILSWISWKQFYSQILKGKVVPVHHAMKAYWWSGGIDPLDGGEWSASRPGHYIPRERAPGAKWRGGWVGPRADLDVLVTRKIPSPCRDSNPWLSSP